MKHLVCVALLLTACAPRSTIPTVTRRISDVKTPLDGFKGKVVLLNFWAEWCAPCVSEIPVLTQVASEAGSEVVFLPIWFAPDDELSRDTLRWVENQPPWFSTTVFWGNAALHARYPHPNIPLTIVLGRNGSEVKRFLGAIDKEPRISALKEAISVALGTRAESEVDGGVVAPSL